MKFESIQEIMTMANKMITFPMNISTTSKGIIAKNASSIIRTIKPFNKPVLDLPKISTLVDRLEGSTKKIESSKPDERLQTNIKPLNKDISSEELRPTTAVNNAAKFNQKAIDSKPIYVSSLGELSTDLGNDFDINKVDLLEMGGDSGTAVRNDIKQDMNEERISFNSNETTTGESNSFLHKFQKHDIMCQIRIQIPS